MTHYFIEFRFHGKAKREIKKLIWQINKKFGVSLNKRPIPHITLIALFYTKEERRLINDFKNTCKKHPFIKFKVGGYGTFQKSRVVFIKIYPSTQMIEFRKDLIKNINPYSKLDSTDVFSFLGLIKINKKYLPHATIAIRLNPTKFKKIKNYVQNLREHHYEHNLIRATLIKNSKILREYDFVQKRLLNRREAKSKKEYKKTTNLFNRKFYNG